MKPHRIIEGAEPVVGGDLGQPLTARNAAVDGLFYGIIAIAMVVLLLYGGLGEIFEL
jgi:hypothetical protein